MVNESGRTTSLQEINAATQHRDKPTHKHARAYTHLK